MVKNSRNIVEVKAVSEKYNIPVETISKLKLTKSQLTYVLGQNPTDKIKVGNVEYEIQYILKEFTTSPAQNAIPKDQQVEKALGVIQRKNADKKQEEDAKKFILEEMGVPSASPTEVKNEAIEQYKESISQRKKNEEPVLKTIGPEEYKKHLQEIQEQIRGSFDKDEILKLEQDAFDSIDNNPLLDEGRKINMRNQFKGYAERTLDRKGFEYDLVRTRRIPVVDISKQDPLDPNGENPTVETGSTPQSESLGVNTAQKPPEAKADPFTNKQEGAGQVVFGQGETKLDVKPTNPAGTDPVNVITVNPVKPTNPQPPIKPQPPRIPPKPSKVPDNLRELFKKPPRLPSEQMVADAEEEARQAKYSDASLGDRYKVGLDTYEMMPKEQIVLRDQRTRDKSLKAFANLNWVYSRQDSKLGDQSSLKKQLDYEDRQRYNRTFLVNNRRPKPISKIIDENKNYLKREYFNEYNPTTDKYIETERYPATQLGLHVRNDRRYRTNELLKLGMSNSFQNEERPFYFADQVHYPSRGFNFDDNEEYYN